MSSDINNRLSEVHHTMYRAIMDSEEGLEALQTAATQEAFEEAILTLVDDILKALGEADLDPWTPEDTKQWQIYLLEQEIERAQRRLDQLNK